MHTIAVTTSYGPEALTSADRIIATLDGLTPELVLSLGEPQVV
jgi:hypothetical protein